MKTIVSMTSWKKRIHQAHYTIETILNQSMKPDLVEINLDRENFPNEMADMPVQMKRLVEENDNVKIYFNDIDLHCWQKLIPTWRRHKGEEFINITIDDDFNYPFQYVEGCKRMMMVGDWGCTFDNVLTQGQEMVYSSKITNQIIDMFTDEVVLACPLDDYVIYHTIHEFTDNHRAPMTIYHPECRGFGYSFRRNFYRDVDPATLSQGYYPKEEFLREREWLNAHGWRIP